MESYVDPLHFVSAGFFVDVEGHPESLAFKRAMNELAFFAEKIYRSMMIDEYGKMMAKAGGIGITDQIMAQLLQQQESAPALQSAPKTDGGSL